MTGVTSRWSSTGTTGSRRGLPLLVLAFTLGPVPAGAAASPRPADVMLDDPDPGRMVLGPTAVSHPRGRFRWTISDFLVHHLDYGLTDRLQVGMQSLLPVIYVGFFPQLKLSLAAGEGRYIALHIHGGIFWPYVEPETLRSLFTGRFALYGGGVILTKVMRPFTLNVALTAYGLRYGQKEFKYVIEGYQPITLSRVYYDNYWALLPSLGAGWQVSRRVKLNLEVHLPVGDFVDVGKIWLIMYGVRAFGRETYIDLSFVLPVYPDLGEIIRYIPLGIPLASVGLQW